MTYKKKRSIKDYGKITLFPSIQGVTRAINSLNISYFLSGVKV
jgi:hypothetical protein